MLGAQRSRRLARQLVQLRGGHARVNALNHLLTKDDGVHYGVQAITQLLDTGDDLSVDKREERVELPSGSWTCKANENLVVRACDQDLLDVAVSEVLVQLASCMSGLLSAAQRSVVQQQLKPSDALLVVVAKRCDRYAPCRTAPPPSCHFSSGHTWLIRLLWCGWLLQALLCGW